MGKAIEAIKMHLADKTAMEWTANHIIKLMRDAVAEDDSNLVENRVIASEHTEGSSANGAVAGILTKKLLTKEIKEKIITDLEGWASFADNNINKWNELTPCGALMKAARIIKENKYELEI